MNKIVLIVALASLQACGSPKPAAGDATVDATASSRPAPPAIAQDPAVRSMTGLERLTDVAPDFKAEVGRAAGCHLAETGMPADAAMIAHLEASVRLNGGKAPKCRARDFEMGSPGSGPPVVS